MGIFPDIFTEIAVILLLAATVGAIGVRLRQPLIVAFIAVGILIGPSGLEWVAPNDRVDLLAKLGIALLLFVVGLKLDLHIIRSMGPVALATGLGQVAFTSLIGYLIALLLGLPPVPALYVAVALTFSSTIIIVKLLSDKREADTLYGRIALGFLIVQDLVVVLVMIGLNTLGELGDAAWWYTGATILLKGLAGVAFLVVVTRYLLPPLLSLFSRSQELLVLFGITWAVALAALATALGFSKEVGAFVAGITLASTPYRDALGSRLVSLRDFLLLFFFIDLGAGLDLSLLGGQIRNALIFSLFVLIGNPLIVMVIMGSLGYRRRTSFMAGLTVAQISEFSLIFGALGLSLGHIETETLGLITLVGLITISVSTYMILYAQPLFNRLSPALRLFERKTPAREMAAETDPLSVAKEVLIFGAGRYGKALTDALKAQGAHVVSIDQNPQLVRESNPGDTPILFGDAEDPNFLAHLSLERASWVISTVRHQDTNSALMSGLRNLGFAGRIAVTVDTPEEGAILAREGADVILTPFTEAARVAAERLLDDPS